jgi:hypothetical protein
VVYGILMQVTGVIPKVAALVGRESMLVGWGVRMAITVFVGVTFTLIFGLLPAVSLSAALGLFYGLVWWLLGGLTLMPLRLGMGLFVFDTAAWQTLAGHLMYGLTLGTVYALVGRAGVGRWSPERAGRPVAGEAGRSSAPKRAGATAPLRVHGG